MKKLGKNALANLTLDESCQIDLGSTVTAVDSTNYKTNIVWGANHDNPILEDAEFRKQNYDVLDYTREVIDTTQTNGSTVHLTKIVDYTGSSVIIPSRINGTKIFNISAPSPSTDEKNDTIKEVFIPNQITSISTHLFANCNSLESAKVDCSKATGGGLFYHCVNLKKAEIKAQTLSSWVFSGCTTLSDVKLFKGMEHINTQAFYGCKSLTNIEIPSSVIDIGISTFENCSNLTNITISNGVQNIGERAFKNCTSLVSIKIPNSVESLGASLFEGCSNLKNVYIDKVEGSLDTSNLGLAVGSITWLRKE